MIILDADERNIVFSLELTQAKMLLGILRHASPGTLVAAGSELTGAGFLSMTAADAEIARLAAVAVLAPTLDKLVCAPALKPAPEKPAWLN